MVTSKNSYKKNFSHSGTAYTGREEREIKSFLSSSVFFVNAVRGIFPYFCHLSFG